MKSFNKLNEFQYEELKILIFVNFEGQKAEGGW